MIAYIIVYLILFVLSAIAVYAMATPVHRGRHDLGECEQNASSSL